MSTSPRTESRGPIPGAWIDDARDGDRDALQRVLRAVHPAVLRWARTFAADPDEADDVAQEVLVSVTRRIGGFHGRSSFESWLYRITRNAALDRRRETKRRTKREQRSVATEARTPVSPDFAGRVYRDELLATAEAAFRALPDRQREVFDLSDLQGLPGPEIAERLRIAPSTVRVTLMKARRTLRSALLEMDPDRAEEEAS